MVTARADQGLGSTRLWKDRTIPASLWQTKAWSIAAGTMGAPDITQDRSYSHRRLTLLVMDRINHGISRAEKLIIVEMEDRWRTVQLQSRASHHITGHSLSPAPDPRHATQSGES
ncbi:hypothetical protein Mapa_007480 [Marchantia paleacea]|nr:hypothetical protein Mapa_007480 [Marchantia paleacea]